MLCCISLRDRAAEGQFCRASFLSADVCLKLRTKEMGEMPKEKHKLCRTLIYLFFLLKGLLSTPLRTCYWLLMEYALFSPSYITAGSVRNSASLLYFSLPSFFGMSLNEFSTLDSVFVPAALQPKYVNLVQVEYENKAIGFFFSFIRIFNNYCFCCGISHRPTLEILMLLIQFVLWSFCISQTV